VLKLQTYYYVSFGVAPMPLAPAQGRGRFPTRSRGTLLAGPRRERLTDRFALHFSTAEALDAEGSGNIDRESFCCGAKHASKEKLPALT